MQRFSPSLLVNFHFVGYFIFKHKWELAGCIILGWQLFVCFRIWKMSLHSHSLLAWKVSSEKLIVGFPLYAIWSLYIYNCFSILCVQLRKAWQHCVWVRIFLGWVCLGFSALPVCGFPLCSQCFGSSLLHLNWMLSAFIPLFPFLQKTYDSDILFSNSVIQFLDHFFIQLLIRVSFYLHVLG